MNDTIDKSTETAPVKGAPEQVAYVTKAIAENAAPDSIEYGKPAARTKVYGNLATPEGQAAMKQKLEAALQIIAGVENQGSE